MSTKNPTFLKQVTFDEAVRDELELDDEIGVAEAVKDALESYRLQGVQTLYIIQEVPEEGGEHKVARLAKLLQSGDLSVLGELTRELQSDPLPKRYYACEAGCLHGTLDVLLQKTPPSSNLPEILDCTIACLDKQPDWAGDGIISASVSLLISSTDSIITKKLLSLIQAYSIKHEKNRAQFQHFDGLSAIGAVLATENPSPAVAMELCATIQTMVVDDDIREVSCRAHQNARDLVTDFDAIGQLCRILKATGDNNEELKKSIFLTLSKILVRNEFCQEAAEKHGLLGIISNNLEIYGSLDRRCGDAGSSKESRKLLRPCLLLLKAMCGNDEVKHRTSKTPGLMQNIVVCLKKWSQSVPVVEAALSCCHVICLREPDNCLKFAAYDLPEACIQAMKDHPKETMVQRACANVVRNMVARTRDLQKFFLEQNVEDLLNDALVLFANDRDTKEAIRAAQRDLDIDFGAVELWKGLPEEGGKGRAVSSFNPTYD